MNEEDCIFRTIAAYFNTNYPKDRLEIIVIDDGSTDNTWKEIQKALIYKKSRKDLDALKIHAIRFSRNRGKRKAMSIGIRVARGEIVVMNDSDSIVHPDALYKIVQPFADPEVAGVAGHTDVENRNTLISKMQVVRYYIAFKVYKSAEALFGSVICLSGCFSAYRRRYLLQVLDEWEYQTFLGIPCTYGDDRGLTTYLLKKGYKTLYVPDAKATTVVPSDLKTLWKQQLRWKKSWVRETYLVSGAVFRRHPVFAASFFIHVFLTFAGFLVAMRAVLLMPLLYGILPIHYIGGLAVISTLYVAYYRINHRDGMGWYSLIWILFYLVILSWQVFWAMLTLKDNRWGTREAKHPSGEIRQVSLPVIQVASA
jgi:hyaluronan synthase